MNAEAERELAAELGITFESLRYRRRQAALGLFDESLILHRGPLPVSNGQRKPGEIGNAEWHALNDYQQNAETQVVLDKIPGATRWEKQHLNHVGAEQGKLSRGPVLRNGNPDAQLIAEIMSRVDGICMSSAAERELKYRNGIISKPECFLPINGKASLPSIHNTKINFNICPVTEGCVTRMSADSFDRTCRAKRKRMRERAMQALFLEIKTIRCNWCKGRRRRWPDELEVIEVDA